MVQQATQGDACARQGSGAFQSPCPAAPGAYGGIPVPRHSPKTSFIAGLLSPIVFVGFGMATVHPDSKDRPSAFDGGKAAGAGFVAFVAACAAVILIWGAIDAVLIALSTGGAFLAPSVVPGLWARAWGAAPPGRKTIGR